MDGNSLSHTKWNCKYHIVFAPKYRRKIAYGVTNNRLASNPEEYEKRYNELSQKYKDTKDRYDKICNDISEKLAKKSSFKAFIHTLKESKTFVKEFDIGLWSSLVDHATVKSREEIIFI